jgi:hypothetical protein
MRMHFWSLAYLYLAAPVSADPIVFGSETDFLSAIDASHFESFEDSPAVSFVTMLSTSLFTVEVQPLDGGSAYLVLDDTDGAASSLHATDGSSYLNVGSLTNDSWLLTFTLNFAIDAVAFTMSDPLERPTASGGQSEVRLATNGGDSVQIGTCPVCLPTGSELFFGVAETDSPFTSFSILNTAFSDGIGFDGFYVRATNVPEPGTLGLLSIGLFAMGLARRKGNADT